ncbi:hypothetical protein [Streptomyces sp. GbtcB7]|uniref:hypothetical protein n=1 Tax=Streptomyces sp. GbtcB7 TaxID=2824752 RepID=UPI001C30A935|nr:hypothetical protein [Streptomyces sp. GbtcB7]
MEDAALRPDEGEQRSTTDPASAGCTLRTETMRAAGTARGMRQASSRPSAQTTAGW